MLAGARRRPGRLNRRNPGFRSRPSPLPAAPTRSSATSSPSGCWGCPRNRGWIGGRSGTCAGTEGWHFGVDLDAVSTFVDIDRVASAGRSTRSGYLLETLQRGPGKRRLKIQGRSRPRSRRSAACSTAIRTRRRSPCDRRSPRLPPPSAGIDRKRSADSDDWRYDRRVHTPSPNPGVPWTGQATVSNRRPGSTATFSPWP